MQTHIVVKDQPPTDAATCLANRGVRLDVHVLIFQAAPKALDEDVVEKPPFAVHADPHTAIRQFVNEIAAGELHTLDALLKVKLA